MGCCDAFEPEEELFALEERIAIEKELCVDMDDDELDGWLTSIDYVSHILSAIQNQLPTHSSTALNSGGELG